MIPHIDDVPDLMAHLAKRNTPPILRYDRHGYLWEVVNCFGAWFRVPYDWQHDMSEQ